MSCGRVISVPKGRPACMATMCGAKVKGMSPRSSGRARVASTAGVSEDILADVGWEEGRVVSAIPLFPALDG